MCCMPRRRFLIVSLIVLVASSTPSLAAVSFDVSRVDKISIDGDDADWGERGLRVEFLTSTTGRLFAEKDCSAKAKIGWDDGGLLVFARVLDDVRDENPKDEPLGRNDSLEVFLSDGVGSPQSYQFTIAAGAPGGKPRSAVTDRRATKDRKSTRLNSSHLVISYAVFCLDRKSVV